MLVEVNPMIVTGDRRVAALDAKVTLDDNALFRHPDNAELRDVSGEDPQERMARERGLTYVKLDGNVGILGNGAGLVMCTLDVVAQAGGAPGELPRRGRRRQGGGDHERRRGDPLQRRNVTAVLFNIFGGITRCDEVARGPDRGVRRRSSPTCRSSCASTARTTRRAARCSPRPTCPTCTRRRRCSAPPRKVVELAARMSILVDTRHAGSCVSGITGREGTFHTLNNKRYGTQRRRAA